MSIRSCLQVSTALTTAVRLRQRRQVNKYLGLHDVKKVADYVGDDGEPPSRLEDGTFFRKEMMHHFHNMTMWADD